MNEMPQLSASAYSNSTGDIASIFNDKNSAVFAGAIHAINQTNPTIVGKEIKNMASTRIVKVFVADPDENIPVEKRLLYSGEEKLTELTDQELYFELPFSELLAAHNEYRKTLVDKKQSEKFGRDIYLEPVRIRDLKMVVLNVAQF